VTRSALVNATSIAGMLLTTETLIVEKPEDEEPRRGRPRPRAHGPLTRAPGPATRIAGAPSRHRTARRAALSRDREATTAIEMATTESPAETGRRHR
jgi:hypothetical protein